MKNARLITGLCALMLCACSYQRFAPRHGDLVDIPESYLARLQTAPGEITGSCANMNLPGLDRLLQRMANGNFELQEAAARLHAANALAERAGAARWPSLQASIGASRGESLQSAQLPQQFALDQGIETQYRAALMASYEVDLWRRIGSQFDAAALEAQATAYTRDALLVTLAARTAETWASLLAQREIIALLNDQLKLSRDYLELTETRYGTGGASGLDVIQQRQQLESLRAELAMVQANASSFAAQLATLLGTAHDQAYFASQPFLPSPPPLPAVPLPVQLLERRPDVMAAFLELQSADQRTAAALAERMPGLSFSASVTSLENSAQDLFQDLFWQLGAELMQSVFDAGGRAAAVEEAEAIAEAMLYRYGQTMLTALEEVEIAWLRNRRQQEFIASLRSQIASAEQALDLTRSRYIQGAADYLRLLTALQSLQQLQRQLIEAEQQQFANRIELCRALGSPPGMPADTLPLYAPLPQGKTVGASKIGASKIGAAP